MTTSMSSLRWRKRTCHSTHRQQPTWLKPTTRMWRKRCRARPINRGCSTSLRSYSRKLSFKNQSLTLRALCNDRGPWSNVMLTWPNNRCMLVGAKLRLSISSSGSNQWTRVSSLSSPSDSKSKWCQKYVLRLSSQSGVASTRLKLSIWGSCKPRVATSRTQRSKRTRTRRPSSEAPLASTWTTKVSLDTCRSLSSRMQ